MKSKIVSLSFVQKGNNFVANVVYADGAKKELPVGHPDVVAYMEERRKLAGKKKK